MKPEKIKITPAMATAWLKFNTGNRKLPTGNAKFYQRLIETGQFATTHQGLAFVGNIENPIRLIDGQTRLVAIAKSGISLTQWVFWECEENTFETIDGGKPRSFIDHHGWSKDRVAFCNSIWRMASTALTDKMTKSDADSVWEKFGDLFSELMGNCPTSKKSLTATSVRVGAVLAMHQNQEKSEQISDQYRHMVLGAVESMVPSVGRLMVKLLSIEGGGGSAQMTQFAYAHKAFTPKNWGSTKLYAPDDDYIKSVKSYIKLVIGTN